MAMSTRAKQAFMDEQRRNLPRGTWLHGVPRSETGRAGLVTQVVYVDTGLPWLIEVVPPSLGESAGFVYNRARDGFELGGGWGGLDKFARALGVLLHGDPQAFRTRGDSAGYL